MLQDSLLWHGVTGNSASLDAYRRGMDAIWRKWLRRRSNAAARKTWDWWNGSRKRYPLPPARVVHSVYRPTT